PGPPGASCPGRGPRPYGVQPPPPPALTPTGRQVRYTPRHKKCPTLRGWGVRACRASYPPPPRPAFGRRSWGVRAKTECHAAGVVGTAAARSRKEGFPMPRRASVLALVLLLAAAAFATGPAPQVSLWPHGAPGSEGVTEKEIDEPPNAQHG